MDSSPLDTDEIADIYDELIDTYELEWQREGHRSLHLGYYDDEHDESAAASINTMRVLSEAANIESSDRILNIGCGVGEDSVWNARAYGATVVGINISERQLDLARENARQHDVADLTEFRYDDFHTMETVETDSIDVVWGLEALSHSPDRGQVLEQARRVLGADGRIALTDLFLTPEAVQDDETTRKRIERIDENLGLRLGTIDEFEAQLSDHSFRDIDIRDATDAIRPSTERRYKFARLAHPLGRLLGIFGLFSETQMGAFKASADIHKLVADGSLGYYVITAESGDA